MNHTAFVEKVIRLNHLVSSCKFQRQLKPANKHIRRTNGKIQCEAMKIFKLMLSYFEDEIETTSWTKMIKYYLANSVHHGVIALPNGDDIDRLIKLYEKMDNALHVYIETNVFTSFI